jgi:hypothetical protein
VTTDDARIDPKRVLFVGMLASLLIAAAGLAAYAYRGDVPRGTRVLGVDLGGKSRSDAERKMHTAFDPRAAEPVDVSLNGERHSITPSAIAMTLDVDLTVGKAIRSGSPMFFGERTSPPVIRLDRPKLQAILHYPADPAAAAAAIKGAWLTGGTARIGVRPGWR